MIQSVTNHNLHLENTGAIFKNPLLNAVPPSPVGTPGNHQNRVWFAQDFSRIEFNGTRQYMRPYRPARSYDPTVKVFAPPPVVQSKADRKPIKFKSRRGVGYVRLITGQIVRATARPHEKDFKPV